MIALLVLSTISTNAIAGTINNPDIIVNGELTTYSTNVQNNWFTFALRENGNILITAEDASGSPIHFIKIYDSELSFKGELDVHVSENKYLVAGGYYMQVTDASGGTFRLNSTLLIPGSGLPSPAYTAGYDTGTEDGKQACIDDPDSCGIESGGFYVIPIPIKQ